jgi:hypothetical protein
VGAARGASQTGEPRRADFPRIRAGNKKNGILFPFLHSTKTKKPKDHSQSKIAKKKQYKLSIVSWLVPYLSAGINYLKVNAGSQPANLSLSNFTIPSKS